MTWHISVIVIQICTPRYTDNTCLVAVFFYFVTKMGSKRLSIAEIQQLLEESDSEEDFASDDSVGDPDWKDDEIIEDDDDELQNVMEEMCEEEADEANLTTDMNTMDAEQWTEYIGRHKNFPFTGKQGIQKAMISTSPLNIWEHIVNDEIIDFIVVETNRFAEQTMKKPTSKSARKSVWVSTTNKEIKNFLGLSMWMGLVQLGKISDYWSLSALYKQYLPSKIMSRNRYQLLLAMIHFCNNEDIKKNDRLCKISTLLLKLKENYQNLYTPGQDFVIDESLVPWRGRLIFKQYIPNKTHKYGIKLFKLCSLEGYTWNIKIYSGKSATGEVEKNLAEKVCMELSEKLLNEGRTLFIDNFYTSYNLAKTFLERKTHVVGTLRANKKDIPKDILGKKISRGEVISKEDSNGIVVLKWRDTRDVRMLSTKHAPTLEKIQPKPTTNKKNRNQQGSWSEEPNPQTSCDGKQSREKPYPSTSGEDQSSSKRKVKKVNQKPIAILAYNNGKAGIDKSDQMTSYGSCLKKGVKWYRKLAFEFLLGISVVNAWVVFRQLTGSKMHIRKFREILVKELLEINDQVEVKRPKLLHHLKDRIINGKKIRRKCVECYTTMTKKEGRAFARKHAKMVFTFCENCESQLCRDCFNKVH